jgi:hypothetical protein
MPEQRRRPRQSACDPPHREKVARLVEWRQKRDSRSRPRERIEHRMRDGRGKQDRQNADRFDRQVSPPPQQQCRAARRGAGREDQRMRKSAVSPQTSVIRAEVERNEVEIRKNRCECRERRD